MSREFSSRESINSFVPSFLRTFLSSSRRACRSRILSFFALPFPATNPVYFFIGLASNRASRRLIWSVTRSRFAELQRRFAGNFSLSRLVEYSFSSLSSESDAKEVQAFFEGKDTSKFVMGLQQGLDAVRANGKWVQRDAEDVKSWLREMGYLK